MAHTPGPWRAEIAKGSVPTLHHVIAADGRSVANCEEQQRRSECTSTSEAKDNALLIAAAPDLLAVIAQIQDTLQREGPPHSPGVIACLNLIDGVILERSLHRLTADWWN